MQIQTQRLYVRPFAEDDLHHFHLINGDEQVMRYIRHATSKEESAIVLMQIINSYGSLPGLGRWAIIEKSSVQLVGMFSLLPLEQTGDTHIGYALIKNHWGKGYASETLKAGLGYDYDELKLPSVVAITHPENVASQKILLNNHFKYECLYNGAGINEFLYRHMPA
jgi:ribosomal-protein-alanine N-acetyltransferase